MLLESLVQGVVGLSKKLPIWGERFFIVRIASDGIQSKVL